MIELKSYSAVSRSAVSPPQDRNRPSTTFCLARKRRAATKGPIGMSRPGFDREK